MKKNTNQLPEFLRPYFWDVKFEDVDIEKNPKFVLKRIIDLGNTQALTWMLEKTSLENIKELLLTSRDLSRRTANFWALMLDVDPKNVICLQKPYSRTPLGL